MSKQPVRVAVTGAAGQIGYSLLFCIASGEMLDKDQSVVQQCNADYRFATIDGESAKDMINDQEWNANVFANCR